MKRKLGELLADMVLYGDTNEALFPVQWMAIGFPAPEDDPEVHTRCAIAATLLKLTNGGEGGSCSVYDALVAPLLQAEVEDGK